MKAKIDNKVLEVEVIKMDYNEESAEVVIREGNHNGCYTIVRQKDLIKEATIAPYERKLKFDDCEIDYRQTTNMFMGEYTYGWKAVYGGCLLASERTKTECRKKARKIFSSLVKQGKIRR